MKLFDAHFHIIDPNFPLKENNGFMPEPFTVKIYQAMAKPYNVVGGAIVSGSFQGFDQGYLINALNILGPNYVGVVNLAHTSSDAEVLSLYKSGIRAVRFNLFRGGSETIEHLVSFACRIYDLCGMHIELYIAGEQIEQDFDLLSKLPKVSIDHLGLTQKGFPSLLKLVEHGAHVKATGFMRVDFDTAKALKKVHAINPEALMLGTDFPGTRASRLFNQSDLTIVQDNFSAQDQASIFINNAAAFYGVSV